MGDVVAERPVEQREDQDEGGELEDAEPHRLGGDAAHQNRSGFTRAIHEVDDGGDRERGRDDAEDDHSFSTPFAIRPTSANSASVAAR